MIKQTQKQGKKTAPKHSTKIDSDERVYETDGTYFLKLVVFVLLGTLWLKLKEPILWLGVPLNGIPLGLFIGLILISTIEKHQSDRKIWYAAILIVTIICYFVPAGIVI